MNDSFECLCYNFSCVYNTGSEIISVVVYFGKYIFTLSFLMPIVDSRHLYSTLVFFYFRLSTFLLSTLDFFTLDSPLFTLDSLVLLSTLDNYSRLSTFTLVFRPSTFRFTRLEVITNQTGVLFWDTR